MGCVTSVTPVVSVVIIFLNEARFIVEAIDSVCTQTYESWELILVDDGSSDESGSIARDFAERFPDRIYYCTHPDLENRGMSASRNLGISYAQGQYIAFLDADDVWLEHKLTEQVAIMESHDDAMMVYGRTLLWHSWTQKPHDARLDHMMPLGVGTECMYKPPQLFPLLFDDHVQKPTTCNVLIRRIFFTAANLFDDSFRGMYEDQIFYAKIMLNESVYVSSHCWAKYRQHPDSCVANASSIFQFISDQRKMLDWLEHYLYQIEYSSSEAWHLVQQQQQIYRGSFFYKWKKVIGIWSWHQLESYKIRLVRSLPESPYRALKKLQSLVTVNR